VAVVGAVLIALALAWRFSPLAHWLEARSRAAWGGEPEPGVRAAGELDAAIWDATLRQWEPFVFEAGEAKRVVELGIATYVPRENLASIEGRVTGRRPDRAEVMDGLHALNRALLRYPERFLRATGFERLVWLRDIVQDGAAVRGFALPPARTMVLDPRAFAPPIFDHELFHMVDFRLHGGAEVPAWNALNPPDAVYIGRSSYANELSQGRAVANDSPYFITDYARATAAEDRAETFRVLIGQPSLARQRRAESAVIEAKSRAIIALLDQLASGSSVALDLR
jgi:hypothetical protein